MPLPDKDKKYTYKDYLSWPDTEKYEIIDGIPYMQAAPSWQHQGISRELILQFGEYLRNKECQVFASPFDLRLCKDDEVDENSSTVLQPDITIICDKSKLQGTGYKGTPLLIIEIVSPSSNKMDKLYKFNKYENYGVKEYWIIEPEGKIVSVFTLQENNCYGRPSVYSENDKITTSVFRDCIIDLSLIFSSI